MYPRASRKDSLALAGARLRSGRQRHDGRWSNSMKIVVVGGTGLIGKRVVERLRQRGHAAIAAAPSTGVDTITRAGLAEVMDGANIVIDVANAPSWNEDAVRRFFETSSRNVLAAAYAAGVEHHIALSIVGCDRNPDNGYLRAKLAQEAIIESSTVPYTVLRSTQFFEFLSGIAESSTTRGQIRLSPALFQPVAADDVVATLVDIAEGQVHRATLEVAGPESMPLDDAVRRLLVARRDPRVVVADVHARYFGSELDDRSLTPGPGARLGERRLDDWLAHAVEHAGL